MNRYAMQTNATVHMDSLLQYSLELLTIVSAHGVIAYQGPSSERILGYLPNEMMGTKVFDYMESDERKRVRSIWEEAVAEKTPLCVFEAALQHKLGFPVYLECCVRLVQRGLEDEWIINARDISERKAMQIVLDERTQTIESYNAKLEELLRQHTADLKAEKTRIESILNSSSDAIVLATSDGRINQTNASFDQLFGLKPDQLFDQPLILAIAPEQWSDLSHALNVVVKTGQRTHLDVTACRMNGTRFDADLAIARLPDDLDGDVVCSLRDITERKQMENSLRENERRFRGLFENNNDAVFIIGLDNIILAANNRAVNMLRYPVEEIVGSPSTRFTADEPGETLKEQLFHTLDCGAVPIYERSFRRADGQIIPTEVNVALVCGEDGIPVHIQSIVRDITERKRIENELRESLAREKELGTLRTRFVSIVSHEFRTPLATIQSASDVLHYYSKKMTQEQIDIRFDKIETQIKHMVSLLEDVLTLGQVQSDAVVVNLTTVNLDEFCQRVLDDLRGTNSTASAILYQGVSDGIEVDADEKLLRQVITNLVTNARKYSPNGIPVHVRLAQAGNSAVLEVSDRGIGIPEEDQLHLYEAFYRASNTGTISGTGLGLAITKHAVELHKGTIAVNSAVGVGTTFTVTLPIKTH